MLRKRTPTISATLALLLILTLTFTALGINAKPVKADMGPKPSMEFTFESGDGVPELSIVEGVMWECSDTTCAEAEILEELGPQGFSCGELACESMAYGYAAYHYLEITFSDGVTRQSNIFSKNHFDASYTVTITPDALVVEEGRGRANPMVRTIVVALGGSLLFGGGAITMLVLLVLLIVKAGKEPLTFANHRGKYITLWVLSILMASVGGYFSLTIPLTVLLELALVFGYVRWRSQTAPRDLLTTLTLVLVANVTTQFGLWGVLNAQATGSFGLLIFLEVVIVAVEALLLYLPQRKQVKFSEAALLSLGLNLVSFLVGLVIHF
jgi:hypothetical protein